MDGLERTGGERHFCIHAWALLSGYVRPFFVEADTLLKFAVALENSLILVLCVSGPGSHRGFSSISKLVDYPLGCIVYGCLLCIFLARCQRGVPIFRQPLRSKVDFYAVPGVSG